jgi:site-specific DNA-adenine methylase
MGSKRKLAKPIIDYILSNNPNTKYFYDLFGGGGAMSFEALQRKKIKQVYYNELNTGVVELIKKIKNDGIADEFYQWIDRDTFHNNKDNNDWFGGLVATCWSFGNNKDKGYLFSEDNEKIKKPLHNIIVNRCEDSIKEFHLLSGLLIAKDLLRADTINQRRLDVMNFLKKSNVKNNMTKCGRFDIECLQNIERLAQLERLNQLQQLTQIESLSRVESLSISNLSYEDVITNTPIDETIIYLDPPYKSTTKYHHDIDFDKLYEYIRKSPYKIYISSYDMPFKECEQFKHRCTLSATSNNKVVEKLFCNQDEIYLDRLF